MRALMQQAHNLQEATAFWKATNNTMGACRADPVGACRFKSCTVPKKCVCVRETERARECEEENEQGERNERARAREEENKNGEKVRQGSGREGERVTKRTARGENGGE